MQRRPGFNWILTRVLAIAVALQSCAVAPGAFAQIAAEPRILNPSPAAPEPGLRGKLIVDSAEPEEVPDPEIEDASVAGRAPAVAGRDDDDDIGVIEDDAPLAPRAAGLDGDLSPPHDEEAPEDGVVYLQEPESPKDGLDTASIDMRSAGTAGSEPPSGYDALLFQVEDVEPLSDRRTDYLFRLDPYEPVGIRLGSFVFFPEAEIGGAVTSNVLLAPDGKSDTSLELKPAARLVSNWRTHALELRGSADLSYHDDHGSEDNRGYAAEARGRIDITRRTNLQAMAGHSRTQESRSAIDASLVGPRADIDTTTAAASINHRFNRLSVQLRAGLIDASYDDGSPGTGLDDRNVRETEQALRATWELKPSLAVFAEFAIDQRSHDVAAYSDGISRNSGGERYRVGLDFGEMGDILRGELSLGWGRQRPDDPRLEDIDGLLLDANIAWRATALTSLLLTARTEFAETTTAGSGGVLVRRVGAEVRHALRRSIIVSAALGYEWRDYEGIDFDETELGAAIGLEYFMTRELAFFTRYDHTDFSSTAPGAGYDADEFRLGMRVRR